MAQKKSVSQAQQAVNKSKKSSSARKQNTKPAQEEKQQAIPARVISSIVCGALFVLFLVIFMNQDGALTNLFYRFLLGMFGEISFYVAIPALLYMFIIQAFSGKRPVIMRSVCLGIFVLICGIMAHLMMPVGQLGEGLSAVADLYKGGVNLYEGNDYWMGYKVKDLLACYNNTGEH